MKLMQTSSDGQFWLFLQPTLHTPLLQTWLAGHCWLEMQEIIHMLWLHCSPTRQSVAPLQANLQVPAWQVLPPTQSLSVWQRWLSLMQVLWSSGLGMKPGRHWHSACLFLMLHSVFGPQES